MLQGACIFVCAHEYAYNDTHTLSLSVTALLSLPSKQIQVKLTSSNSIFSFFILFSAMGTAAALDTQDDEHSKMP